ncbi:hypothetical protein FY528_14200 [Hymenobacter lutimineralis]|uniref:Uncharacterized protein n=1 Tax=Hymenobacter lutimineralis TaxID=2606448 RepID=A0A5D6UXU2_9BACT|nr:hypothetical protein [Hymenobacter lutimineralis]TYZ07845.1 hypothetical protein FY528_14200 [Hymenobacter lutimineralis]
MKTFFLFISYGLAAALFLAAYAAMFASLRGLPRYPLPGLRAQAVPGLRPAAKPATRHLVEPAFFKSRQRIIPRQPALLLAAKPSVQPHYQG